MKRTQILYSVKPTFDLDKEFELMVNWNARRNKYCLDVRRGLRKERFWIKEDIRIDKIMRKVTGLCVPSVVEGPIVLDGTGYLLRIGVSPAVIYNWTNDLPKDWKSLRDIIRLIEEVAADVVSVNASKK
ncbi:MAG: hypothetical protein ACYSSO_10615 [Planctomycetota bacterium]|jgi:hypothetical protein